jgi:hydroxymethylbilane synthase
VCRADRTDLIELLGTLDDPATRAAVTAERAVLATLEAGCSAPVGVYAAEHAAEAVGQAELRLTAAVVSFDGAGHIRLSASGDSARAAELGRDLAARLLADGAGHLMGADAGTERDGAERDGAERDEAHRDGAEREGRAQ